MLRSVVEDIFQSLNVHVAIELREISRELNCFRADFDAVLTVATTCNAALLHESVQTFGRVEFAEWVKIEQISLNSRRGTYEVRLRSDVRASLQATTARHATRNFVSRA